MFSNARTFNDEGSAVFMDANTLQGVVDAKLDEFVRNGFNSVGDDASTRSASPAMGRKRNVVESDDEDGVSATPNGSSGKLKLTLAKSKTEGGSRKSRIDDDESE
jgi:hypothetical protein